jgi:hypothetical protein
MVEGSPICNVKLKGLGSYELDLNSHPFSRIRLLIKL